MAHPAHLRSGRRRCSLRRSHFSRRCRTQTGCNAVARRLTASFLLGFGSHLKLRRMKSRRGRAEHIPTPANNIACTQHRFVAKEHPFEWIGDNGRWKISELTELTIRLFDHLQLNVPERVLSVTNTVTATRKPVENASRTTRLTAFKRDTYSSIFRCLTGMFLS
jgi:hypothetical protein